MLPYGIVLQTCSIISSLIYSGTPILCGGQLVAAVLNSYSKCIRKSADIYGSTLRWFLDHMRFNWLIACAFEVNSFISISILCLCFSLTQFVHFDSLLRV